jgi:3-hydroxyisobutyrate dehydrogenase-like beta-hydroxyacid dehydrogenase
MARAWDLNLTSMEAALASFKKASEAGFGKEDCNAVFKAVGE